MVTKVHLIWTAHRKDCVGLGLAHLRNKRKKMRPPVYTVSISSHTLWGSPLTRYILYYLLLYFNKS